MTSRSQPTPANGSIPAMGRPAADMGNMTACTGARQGGSEAASCPDRHCITPEAHVRGTSSRPEEARGRPPARQQARQTTVVRALHNIHVPWPANRAPKQPSKRRRWEQMCSVPKRVCCIYDIQVLGPYDLHLFPASQEAPYLPDSSRFSRG